jgi:uncharacterized membrane protein YvlD (DUF360 family)
LKAALILALERLTYRTIAIILPLPVYWLHFYALQAYFIVARSLIAATQLVGKRQFWSLNSHVWQAFFHFHANVWSGVH